MFNSDRIKWLEQQIGSLQEQIYDLRNQLNDIQCFSGVRVPDQYNGLLWRLGSLKTLTTKDAVRAIVDYLGIDFSYKAGVADSIIAEKIKDKKCQ